MRIDIKGAIISNDEKWIYDYYGIEAVCPKDVTDKLSEANGDAVEVHINSGGGSVFDGSEIYSELRAYGGDVNIYIDGLAASAASVIACGGNSEISPTAMLMVHNVSTCAQGDWRDMEKESEILQKANRAIAEAYVQKSGMTLDEALEMMDKETWLTAKEAVEKGLCDRISEPNSGNIKLAAAYSNGTIPKQVIDKMQAEKARKKAEYNNSVLEKFNKLKDGGVNDD